MVLGIKQMNKIEMLNQKNNIDKEEIINILEYMNLLFWEQSTQVDTKERESAGLSESSDRFAKSFEVAISKSVCPSILNRIENRSDTD